MTVKHETNSSKNLITSKDMCLQMEIETCHKFQILYANVMTAQPKINLMLTSKVN